MNINQQNLKMAVFSAALILGVMQVALAQEEDTNATTIAYWKFNGLSTNIPYASGLTTNGIPDLATNVGQGTLTGAATDVPASVDDLYVSGQLATDMAFVADAPPASMFNSIYNGGYNGGGASWNAAHNPSESGQVLYPQDQFGNEFVGPSFTEEIFFKSAAETGVKQTLLWNHQGSAYCFLQINEDGNTGDLTFWSYDGSNIQAVRLSNGTGRFDDGQWHCAVCRFDASTKIMSLYVINQNGSTASNSVTLTQNLNPEGPGDTYIGNDETSSTRFNGEINQVRISNAAIPNSALLAVPGGPNNPHIIAYWQMSGLANGLVENPINGIGILDLATNLGQGSLSGSASNYDISPTVNNLFVTGATLPGNMAFTNSVPPASMFNTNYPYSSGPASWDAGANINDSGEVYYPQDVYGNVFSTPSFTAEVFFKSDAESTNKQTLIWNHQGSAYCMLQINESADVNTNDIGSLLFWSWNVATFPTVRITAAENNGERFDDGQWHYAACIFDAATTNMTLLVVNQDGSSVAVSQTLTAELNPGGAGDTIIGNDETGSYPFDGQINQVRMSDVALPPQELLAAVPECIAPSIITPPVSTTNYIGDIASFSVTASGGSLSYQWQFNGSNLLGQTNKSLTIFPVQTTNAGDYDVVVSTPCGSITSTPPAVLTVIPTVRPVINIARWSMESQILAPNSSGVPTFNGIADSDTYEQEKYNLITFNAGDGGNVPLTNDVPPATMFINGNNAGSNSFNAAILGGADGALFYPQDQYGDVFDFQTSFSLELFFKTLGDQSGTNKMQLIAQGSDTGNFRYGVDVNEVAPGAVTFAVKNSSYQTVSLTNANYADGNWHYLLAEYDSTANQISLTVVNTNGTAATAVTTLPTGFSPLFNANTGNLFIGRYNYPWTADPRNFQGEIDEVQVSQGLVTPNTGQLGFIPAIAPLRITGISVNGGIVTINFTGNTTDTASNFTVLGSSTVDGIYSALPATVTAVAPGNFQAQVATSGSTEFYRIQR
jgi:hypothetical protein